MMIKNNEKIKTGWPIPVNVKESFVTFCASKGTLAQEDCAGALTLWQYLPAEIREMVRLEVKGLMEPDLVFWQDFAAGLRLGIHAQQAARQEKPGKKGKKT